MPDYEVNIEQFEGPLSLLLQLIEKDELDITELSLAKVTDDYLNYVNTSPNIRSEELADFLVVASKLILIKSKQLMPNLITPEEEGIDLETQLKMYREFVHASQKINTMIKERRWAYGRERSSFGEMIGFFPPKGLKTADVREAFERIVKRLEPYIALPKEALQRTVSISEKIEHIRKLIGEQAQTKFSEVLSSAKNKTEVIVSFLALLELTKRRVVSASQENLFEDITIKKSEI